MRGAPADRPASAEWLHHGQQALRAGRTAEARQAFRAAVQADPANPAAWLRLARLSSPRARLAYTSIAVELSRATAAEQQARAELRRVRRLGHAGPWNASAGAGAVALPQLAPAPLTLRPPQFPTRAAAWLLALALVGGGALALPAVIRGAGSGEDGEAGGYPPAVARVLAQLDLLTPTPSPTATFTPTATPTPSPTATASPTPTATFTPAPPTATPIPTQPGVRWIDVDLSDQVVVAYEGQTPVNRFIVSTGTWQFPTVTGQYPIYVKYVAADMSGPGYYLPDVPYIMYFYQGYGLHGTYWHNNFGTPMSHGCVNLRTEDAEWLFHWASVGTVVNVHE